MNTKLLNLASLLATTIMIVVANTNATPAPTTPHLRSASTQQGCWQVSVERDATYCIQGPICSGSGSQPAGWNCPKRGDVAVDACRRYLASYVEMDKCVLPVDTECRVIHTGAWGCVMKSAPPVTPAPSTPIPTPAVTTPKPTPAVTTPLPPKPTPSVTTSKPPVTPTPYPTYPNTTAPPKPTPNTTAPANRTRVDTNAIQFPSKRPSQAPQVVLTQTTNPAADGDSPHDSTSVVAGAAGAVAAVACVVLGVAIYKRSRRSQDIDLDSMDMVGAAVTPPSTMRTTSFGGHI